MTALADLHIHTFFSDGLNSPDEILEIVRKKSLTAFSITDHDNVGGYLYLSGKLGEDDPELISGVELSAGFGNNDIHILGYYIDVKSDKLNDALERFRNRRNQRGVEMLNKLRKLGINIPLETVQKYAGKSAIGRPNVADALVETGAAKTFGEAFDIYIGYDKPAYVPKENMAPKEAIELIHAAGGLAILAHPGIADAGTHIDEFIRYGLDGIEAFHPMHNSLLRKRYKEYADKKHILATGGSDYHGRQDKYGQIGSVTVPENLIETMIERLSSINRR